MFAGECNYGGRVTDDKDRRLMVSLLKNYYNPNVVTENQYAFSASKVYHVPQDTSLQGKVFMKGKFLNATFNFNLFTLYPKNKMRS